MWFFNRNPNQMCPDPVVPALINDGLHLYVNTESGSDGNDGYSWSSALESMPEVFKRVKRAGTIHLYGKVVEDGLVTPHGVTDVTIIGHAPRPREGNHGRGAGPKGGAADWRYKSDDSDKPMLHITQQGWKLKNLMLRGSEAGGTVLITRNMEAETSSNGMAGDHATFEGCTFQGPSAFGICQEGGVMGVHILGCQFRRFCKDSNAAVLGRLGEGIGSCIVWDVRDNKFIGNWHDIKVGLVDSIVIGNLFTRNSVLSSGIPDDTVSVDLNEGRGNIVTQNVFDGGRLVERKYDRWFGNFNLGDVK